MRAKVSDAVRSARACNQWELRVNPEAVEAVANPAIDETIPIDPPIWIDGTFLDETHAIDLPLLVQSLHQEGWFEIFTCSCGNGGCAGIVEGIHVTHRNGLVHWWLRRPQSAGRRMSRTAAEQAFTETDLAAQTAGAICRKDKGLIDEIPGACKDIDQVMADQSDLTEMLYILKQVLCVKG